MLPNEGTRLDAPEKVTGAARFTADLVTADCLHGALVLSTVAAGDIIGFDTGGMADIVALYTHENAPPIAPGPYRTWLQSGAVHHAGQPVALVVAETPEAARAAAAALKVVYRERATLPRLHDANAEVEPAGDIQGKPGDTMRGDLARGRSLAQQHIAAAYGTPTHCHNPLERGVAIVRPSDAGLEVFTATSGIFAARRALAQALGRPETGIVVRMLYQGAGFGAKGGAWWPSLILAASVAVALGRPLQLELTRRDMFTVSGRRAPTRQQLSLGAADGLLTYLDHEAIQETSPTARYADPTGFATRSVYGCANVATRHRLVTTNIPQPNAMRAPGETPGSFALESAIDELAHATGRDPVDFRLANIAARDEQAGRDWSSNGLAACLRGGARAFGWHGSGTARHEGRWAIGQGVAAAYYPVHRARAEARLTRTPEGIVILSCGNQDIGNGSRTVMAEAAARILGLDAAAIEVRYGDTTLPEAPMSAGSMSTASVIPAVEAAARALQAKLSGRRDIGEITASGVSDVVDNGFSHSAFGACFVRVKIDRGLGLLRLVQVTGVYALGRVINERLTRAQLVGGIVGGIGGALMERVEEDAATGLPLNRHLSGYLVPTCADMPAIDVRLLAEPAAAGIKGAGMIGSVGIAAAIANAVFDATGRRIRNLPIGVEALLG